MNISGLNVKAFKDPLNRDLSGNLTQHSRDSIAGLLALDYLGRLNSEPDIEEHANWCTANLKAFLKQKVIMDDSFASNMTLFSMAIAPISKSAQDGDNMLSQLESNDLLVDSLVEMHFGDFSPSDKKKVKLVIQALISGKDGEAILNYIASEPKLIRGMVADALIKHQTQKDINHHVRMEMNKILERVIGVNKKIASLKAKVNQITAAVSVVAVATMGLLVPAVALPFLAVPALITSIKYSPKLGNSISKMITERDNTIKETLSSIEHVKSNLIEHYKAESLEYQKQQNQQTSLPKVPTKEVLSQIDFSIPSVKIGVSQEITSQQGRSMASEIERPSEGSRHPRINTAVKTEGQGRSKG